MLCGKIFKKHAFFVIFAPTDGSGPSRAARPPTLHHIEMKHTYLLLAPLLALLLAACHDSPDDPWDDVETADKTVFVFMPYTGSDDNDLYPAFQQNLNDMAAAIDDAHGLGRSRLVAFVADRNGQSGRLISFAYRRGRTVRDTLKTYPSRETYLTATGRVALLRDVQHCAPAATYAMIVGCHGEGWLPASSAKKVQTRYFGGASVAYLIDVADFAASLSQAGLHLQYLLFDDCYMSGVEVAYALRGVTDRLIASTSEMMGYGMPYRKIMGQLLAVQPDYGVVCSEFRKFYESYSMPYGTIGVTDCRVIGEMAALMAEANAAHTFGGDADATVQDLDGRHFTPTVYFDFGSYTRRLCQGDEALLSRYEALLARLVPYKACTDYIYSQQGSQRTRLTEFSGLAISDPSANARVATAKKETEWWKATHE